MPKVIQVRGVPDTVYDALVAAADSLGISLTKFVRQEMERVAARAESARRNEALLREAQSRIDARLDRAAILSAIHDARDE